MNSYISVLSRQKKFSCHWPLNYSTHETYYKKVNTRDDVSDRADNR